MKKTFGRVLMLVAIMLLMGISTADAQGKKVKFGQVSTEEFSVRPSEKDSSATAIYLHEKDDYTFTLTVHGLKVSQIHDARILVLKDDGKDYANFTVPEGTRALKACAINMENGKQVRTDMKKENINVEELSKGKERYSIKKCAVPEVRVGTIIDIHYEYDHDWVSEINFQRSVPIKYRYVNYAVPDIVMISMNSRGYYHVSPKTKEADVRLGDEVYGGKSHVFELNDVPAIKKDDYVNCVADYCSGIDLQFVGINIPGVAWTKNNYDSWGEVFRIMNEDDDFGGQLKTKNPLSAETKSIMASDKSDADKILALTRLVQEKIKWNEHYSEYPKNGIRKALKEGEGNSSDMNFLLYTMLKDAGYDANIILLNPRSDGRLPFGRPFLNKINMAIIQVVTKDGKTLYVDASDKYGWPGVIDSDYMANRALVFDPTSAMEKAVDLSKINTSRQVEQYNMKLSEDGTISGNARWNLNNEIARDFKEAHADDTEDERTKSVESMEERYDCTISDYEVKGMDGTVVDRNFTMEKETTVSADGRITLNPMIIPFMAKNPFTEEERMLPVEFSYPANYIVTSVIELPDGYVAEELPRPIQMQACDGKLALRYTIGQQDNRLTTNFTFNHKETLLPVTDYKDIAFFFAELSRLSNLQIVLKKQ
ncbi:MAG: hypothetical protein MJZ29_02085 [Bacteroidaceae bacterium]|nr:hypothetical protein [Bacteroidaceae bacterium]